MTWYLLYIPDVCQSTSSYPIFENALTLELLISLWPNYQLFVIYCSLIILGFFLCSLELVILRGNISLLSYAIIQNNIHID